LIGHATKIETFNQSHPPEAALARAAGGRWWGGRDVARSWDRERRFVRKIICCTYLQLTCGGAGSILGHVGPPKHACLWRLGPGSPPKGGRLNTWPFPNWSRSYAPCQSMRPWWCGVGWTNLNTAEWKGSSFRPRNQTHTQKSLCSP